MVRPASAALKQRWAAGSASSALGMAATREQELWTFAAAFLKRHGERAPVVIATRIVEAATQDAGEQIEFWKTIAARIHALMEGQNPVH